MGTEADDLRSTLESAFDDADNDTPETPETPPQEPVTPTPIPEGEAPKGEQQTPENADRGDGRTVKGKFAKKEGAEGKPAPVQQTLPLDDRHDPFARAPQSWKPGAREAWGQLPPPVREEVYRRERESQRLLSETGQARQTAQYVHQLAQQFAPALQAENVDVLTATQNLMNLASRLRFGTPQEKAGLAAQIIRNYQVDIATLDQVLSQSPQPQSQPQMLQDPRVDQLMAQLQSAQQQRQQQIVTGAQRDVETFGSDKEWFEDVREDMADLMEMAANRQVDMTLEQAYERACAMNSEISRVMAARAEAANAGNLRQSTQRAKHAASSVRGTPSLTSTPPANDLRSEIEAAIEQVGGR